jgi:hypothetical protein
MKRIAKLLAGAGLIAMFSTAAFAGGSYGFSFSYGSGYPGYGCGPRYLGGFTYGYNYCAPSVVYYAPMVQYYTPPVTYYQYQYTPPTYYYSGGNFYCR